MLICYHAEARWQKLPSVDIASAIRHHTLAADCIWFYPQDIFQIRLRHPSEKAGYMTKGFKLKREVVEQFEDACRKTGVSQASQITEMMKKFIEEQNKQ